MLSEFPFWDKIYLSLTNLAVFDLLSYTGQVKHPSAWVKPPSQASSKLGLNSLSKYNIFSLYFKLKALNHNLNCSFLVSRKIFPFNIEISFNIFFLSLTL